MSNRKFSESINGKGYYIALVLCAIAIGISGYLFYRNQEGQTQPDPLLNVTAAATVDAQEHVQAVATQPQLQPTQAPTQSQQPTAPGKLQTASPIQGQTIAAFSMDALSYNETTRDWRVHNGVDIAAEEGSPVCAAADGTVYAVFEDDTMGMTVVIRHTGGYTTEYACLAQEVSVAPGDAVKMGQSIGCVGQTALLEAAIGHHVHFAVTCDGVPVDPAQFLAVN